MKFEKRMLRSKLARRVFAMFLLCALVPITGLSLLSLKQVSKQLETQSYRRLKQLTKTYSLSIYERLTYLDRNLRMLTAMSADIQKSLDKGLSHPFDALAISDKSGKYKTMFGSINRFPVLNRTAYDHLKDQKSVLLTIAHPKAGTSVYMAVAAESTPSGLKILLARIKPSYLFGKRYEDVLPYGTDAAILDSTGHLVFSSLGQDILTPLDAGVRLNRSAAGRFEITYRKKTFFGSFRQLFLSPQFLESNWTIALLQLKSDVLSPISSFKTIFPLVAALTLLIVIIFSLYSIRRSLTPLDILNEATQRISTETFGYKVKIDSRDEFEDLANAFNNMSNHLEKQFNAINARADVDRAILSSLDPVKIVKTVMMHMRSYYRFDRILVSLLDPGSEEKNRSYILKKGFREPIQGININYSKKDLKKLYTNKDHFIIQADKDRPSYLSVFDYPKNISLLLLPVFVTSRLAAVITIFGPNATEYTQKDIVQARQTADQVAVALTNTSILEELKETNWGAMKALAGTVDAKSPWTAGHSGRVTKMALSIGEVIGLTGSELGDLHRAGLLHDIGKIGVPSAILDKPGKLSDDEYTIIKKHPMIGANILKPIKAFRSIIPMVLQHHERYDGRGYPMGISGRNIVSGGRILAVADAFDAMISSRPYRQGMPLNRVIGIITEESGRQFDPEIVDAFLNVIKGEKARAA